MPPVTAAELIFSEQANHNFSKTLGDIKKHTLSIHNRLQSVLIDAAFVESVRAAYQRPLVANERCGSWYINPELKGGSAYFKSTDGHTGVWKFSSRRLNTHLLEIIGQHDGCIIVDSTRRGKRMPDALSKTIPIWCCVLNRALYPKDTAHHGLHTPPQVVSLSENAQIAARIDQFVESFLALDINLEPLKQHISKPIRPVWITPESEIAATEEVFQDYHPLICCTASRRVTGGEVSEGGYIQGSGDDTENWAFGLTPLLFWANTEVILSTPEDALPDLIIGLIGSQEDSSKAGTLSPIAPTSSLHVASLSSLPSQNLDQIIITILSDITDSSTWQVTSNKLEIGIGTQKIGSRNLRAALPSIIDFVLNARSKMEASPSIFIACSSGKDHSVGVALSLLCLLYDASGSLLKSTKNTDIDKPFIRKRLGWIMTSMPDANPSRTTLQSVNSYLMERPS